MRFNCGPTRAQRRELRRVRLEKWHTWFAWRRVRIGQSECAWLETVLRKGTFHSGWSGGWWEWEYLPVIPTKRRAHP